MEKIKAKDVNARAFLDKYPVSTWLKSGSSHFPKNDSLLNNCSEQFNKEIEKFKSKPIIMMLKEVRLYIIRKMNLVRRQAERYIDPICPKVQRRLDREKMDSLY